MGRRKREEKTDKPDPRYIKCGDHEMRRWAIVCIHLCEGTSREWISLHNSSEEDAPLDWLCPKCFAQRERIEEEVDITNLRPVCVMCVQRIRARFDPKYHALN